MVKIRNKVALRATRPVINMHYMFIIRDFDTDTEKKAEKHLFLRYRY